MKRLAQIGTLAVALLFLLPGLAPATIVNSFITHPFGDSSFIGYGFYDEVGGAPDSENPLVGLDAIVWARVVDYGYDDDYMPGTMDHIYMQTFEYQVQNYSWAIPLGKLTLTVTEPFIPGWDNTSDGSTPIIWVEIPGSLPNFMPDQDTLFSGEEVSFKFGALPVGETTKVAQIRAPWTGVELESTLIDGGIPILGDVLSPYDDSDGGSGTIVPEPGTLLLLGIGLLGVAGFSLRRKRKR